MKLFTPTAPVIIACCLLFIVSACKKDTGRGYIRIEGFDLFDGSGNAFGHVGREDNDWTFRTDLSSKEMALFDFTTNLSLDNTKEPASINNTLAFPNPANSSQYFHAFVSDSVLVKAVLVNKNLEVLAQGARKGKGGIGIGFDLYDRSKFPNKSSYRIYFSFSAAGKPNFKTGYGDIIICQSVDNCFSLY